jgi:hypothetical protein
MQTILEREHLTAYLLGELHDEEQIALEQEYFSSDSAWDQLLAVEDELAYDYLQNKLTAPRRTRFEDTIARTERGRENLAFARSLLDELRYSKIHGLLKPEAARLARYWPIAAAVVLAVSPFWVTSRFTKDLERLRADNGALQARLERELANQHLAPVPIEARFLLTPGQSRGADAPGELELPGKLDSVALELVAPPGFAPGDYVLVIRGGSGNQVWSQSATLAGSPWTIHVPASVFSTGSYEVALRRLAAGEQPPVLATYYFRVTRR